MAKEYTELQLKAKEAGIKGWHLKLAKTLEEELGEVSEAVEEVAEAVEEVVEAVDQSELMQVMIDNSMTWDNAMMNLKTMANKGIMWKFKELVEEGYKKDLAKKKAKQNEMAEKR
jgi:hypothetical protein